MSMTNPTEIEIALDTVANCLAVPFDDAGITIQSKENSGLMTDDITWSKYQMTVNGQQITMTIAAS